MRCPYCSAVQGRCTTTSSGRSITECTSCGRVVEERQTQPHHLFHTRAQDSPLCLVTSDLPTLPISAATSTDNDEEDPFEPTDFITAFSTWSLEPYPVFAQSSLSFAGHLAELERVLETTSASSSSSNSSSASVVVDNLRAYLQIIDVASILGLDYDISDHAFQLFRDCSSATCLRNRSVEALATAALVQAIREAQEPRTLQEISIAANLPQKEIGKYIKILGEALQLSQPINSNSISVHMPRFCTLLQLNKSAQELATHIGEVVINKCFCTRRNPISISAAAIYLACQLEDKRKTQAEICKVTGLTEVTLRKVYKELLENWDDLLPSSYSPVVPPEKAFPTATIASGRSSTSRIDLSEGALSEREKAFSTATASARSSASRIDLTETTSAERDKQPETKRMKPSDVLDIPYQARNIEDTESKDNVLRNYNPVINRLPSFWNSHVAVAISAVKPEAEKNQVTRDMEIDSQCNTQDESKKDSTDGKVASSSLAAAQFSTPHSLSANSISWPFQAALSAGISSPARFVQSSQPSVVAPSVGDKAIKKQNKHNNVNV